MPPTYHLPPMLKLSLLPLVFALIACAEPSGSPPAQTPTKVTSVEAHAVAYEDDWTAILQQAVTAEGLVRYGQINGPLAATFDGVVAAIETFDTGILGTNAEKLAFWMNAYNVMLVKRAIAAGTPASIEAHGFDFFFKTPVTVAGMEVTLDQIENVILRRGDGPADLKALQPDQLDPRLHVGLNCGAVSCPRLRTKAFIVANVDAELDAAMRDFVNGSQHFRVEGETVVLSSLLDWFAADWDATGQPAGDYLLGYLDADRPGASTLRGLFEGRFAAEIKAQPSVRFEYRWDLNAAG